MRTIKKVKRIIEADPLSLEGRILAELITSLEGDSKLSVKDLYSLDEKHFNLAVNLLKDWRLDRYYLGKAKIFDTAFQAKAIQG